jgi:hypothetical protein
MHVYGEHHALDAATLEAIVDGIGDSLARVFELADERGLTPLAAARSLALERLGAGEREIPVAA